MKASRIGVVVGAAAALAAAPTPLLAHPGHGGHHGWLAGALQPLLGLDHFLAALFVAAVVSAGLAAVASRHRRGAGATRRT